MFWVKDYFRRRYGGMNNYFFNVWMLLSRSVYNCIDGYVDYVYSVIVNRLLFYLKFN